MLCVVFAALCLPVELSCSTGSPEYTVLMGRRPHSYLNRWGSVLVIKGRGPFAWLRSGSVHERSCALATPSVVAPLSPDPAPRPGRHTSIGVRLIRFEEPYGSSRDLFCSVAMSCTLGPDGLGSHDPFWVPTNLVPMNLPTPQHDRCALDRV